MVMEAVSINPYLGVRWKRDHQIGVYYASSTAANQSDQ